MRNQKAVVVHRGSRDGYQVARALAERGLLEALVTDLYWPGDKLWTQRCSRLLPARVSSLLHARWSDRATTPFVTCCWATGLISEAMYKMNALPFDWQRRAIRWSDRTLGTCAGRLATDRESALLSYSYYGGSAFRAYKGSGARVLFQLHPHPRAVRDILLRERDLHPACTTSLDKEWELCLPRAEFDQLCAETTLAHHWLAASSFTRQTLIDEGIPGDRIHVIPYGVDAEHFSPPASRQGSGKLRLLFVGTINQRKGIKYLLDALRLLPGNSVELIVCGRMVDGLELFEGVKGVEVRRFVSREGLVDAYQTSDVFVFPSLAEGFGHVLLEAMASGLAVISTTRTAAADLVRPGIEGYVVQPASASELAEAIGCFLTKRSLVGEMGAAARARAEEFSWPRFRNEVSNIISGLLQPAAAMTTR